MDDIEMDLDLGDPVADAGADVLDFSEPLALEASQPQTTDLTTDLIDAETVPEKIHIRGLDDLTTADIKAFAKAHYAEHSPRVEWIDDTSANLSYPDSEIASTALTQLSGPPSTSISPSSPLILRPAKPHPTHTHLSLSIRQAVATDRKRPRAHESSRFYLMHPEHDPRERRRRERGSDGEYSRPRYGDKEHRRRKREDGVNGFSANMYDDDAGMSSDGGGRARRRSSRSRSASPGRERGRDRRNERNGRRRTPPPRYSEDDPDPVGKNFGKELFPGGAVRKSNIVGKELFPNKKAATALKGELFPDKLKKDAALETADLFAKRMSVPFVDGAAANGGEEFPLRSDGLGGRRSVDDWAQVDEAAENGKDGFSIRGTGRPNGISIKGSAGLSIKGSAAQQQAQRLATEEKVRELFPSKVGNKGKELFPERKKTKASDMMF